MQHQQDSTQLEQQINHYLELDSETVLQQIVQTLGELSGRLLLSYGCVDDQVTGQIFYWYFDKHLSGAVAIPNT